MSIAVEVRLGDHEGITEASVVRCIFDLFGEYVGAIDDAGDVEDRGSVSGVSFPDFVFI